MLCGDWPLAVGYSRAVGGTVTSPPLPPLCTHHRFPWGSAGLPCGGEATSPAPWLCAQPRDLLWPVNCQQMWHQQSCKASGSPNLRSLVPLPSPWGQAQVGLLSLREDKREMDDKSSTWPCLTLISQELADTWTPLSKHREPSTAAQPGLLCLWVKCAK